MKRQHLFRLAHRLYRKSPMILLTSIGSVMISIGLVLTMVIFLLHNQATIETDRQLTYGQVDLTIKYSPEDERTEQTLLEQLRRIKVSYAQSQSYRRQRGFLVKRWPMSKRLVFSRMR